jgi:hypothetical protein
MTYLTPNKLITYAKDFDYEVNKEQAKDILDLLDDCLGNYTMNDIVRATDYIINGEDSRYAEYF